MNRASESATHLWAAVQIVVIADIVMSLDNVIAVAAAANGSVPLLMLGLGDQRPADRCRGGADHGGAQPSADFGMGSAPRCLGWIAGDVIATDPAIHPMLQQLFAGLDWRECRRLPGMVRQWTRAPGQVPKLPRAVAGVIVVLVAGSIWRRRRLRHDEACDRQSGADAGFSASRSSRIGRPVAQAA